MSLNKLITFASSKNIVDLLDDDELMKIGESVVSEFKIDEDSCRDWLMLVEKGMKIAKQVYEKKSTPWEGAANVKFPLIANGAITFAAREYPQIVRGDKVVEAAKFGGDPDGSKERRASRISKFMSWQLLSDNVEWEAATDKLLHMLAVVGTVFRKVYFSPMMARPVFELCSPETLIVNNNAKNLESARRVTHRIMLYKNDVVERTRAELFCDIDVDQLELGVNESDMYSTLDSDAPIEFLEQHRFLDLDDDGYAEPYIVTVHRNSHKVVRISARYGMENIHLSPDEKTIASIDADQYFTDFHFIPSPDGSFYSLGFGTLLYPLNESINVLINQLLDSGTLNNMQSGFIGAGCRIKGGELQITPGRWHKVDGAGGRDLGNSIVPLPTKEPSRTLFELLGLMIEIGKDLASVSEILQGNMPTQNSPATTVLALIKQGLTQYSAIHKRVLRSFKKEFEHLYEINSRYLDVIKYLTMIDDPEASPKDFDTQDLDIRPVADPNMSSDALRMERARAVMELPNVDKYYATHQYLEALEAPNIDKLLPPPNPNAPPPPEVQEILSNVALNQAKAQALKGQQMADAADLEMKANDQRSEQQSEQIQTAMDMEKCKAEIEKTRAEAILALAQADAAAQKVALDAYIQALSLLDKENTQQAHRSAVNELKDKALPQEAVNEQQQPSSGMAQPSNDPGVLPPGQ